MGGSTNEPLACEFIVDCGLIERYVAGRLRGPELEMLRFHLLICPHCRRELQIAAAVRDLLRNNGISGEDHD